VEEEEEGRGLLGGEEEEEEEGVEEEIRGRRGRNHRAQQAEREEGRAPTRERVEARQKKSEHDRRSMTEAESKGRAPQKRREEHGTCKVGVVKRKEESLVWFERARSVPGFFSPLLMCFFFLYFFLRCGTSERGAPQVPLAVSLNYCNCTSASFSVARGALSVAGGREGRKCGMGRDGGRKELGMRHVGAAVKDGFTLELSNRVYRAPSGA
jgi:hypothetical protein